MSGDDVYGSEMNEPYELDDAAAEATISGRGHAGDPALADLLGDVRVAFTSQSLSMNEQLASFIGSDAPTPVPSRRFSRMRSLIAAKIAVASAAVVVATGGLAVANALPAPVQHAVSGAVSPLGVNLPTGHHKLNAKVKSATEPTVDPTTVPSTDETTDPTTVTTEPTTVPTEDTTTDPSQPDPVADHSTDGQNGNNDNNGNNANNPPVVTPAPPTDNHDGNNSPDDNTTPSTDPNTDSHGGDNSPSDSSSGDTHQPDANHSGDDGGSSHGGGDNSNGGGN
jgi:hypothetical protein